MKKWIVGLLSVVFLVSLSGLGLAGEVLSVGSDIQSAGSVVAQSGTTHAMTLTQTYEVECYDKYGNLKWKDVVHNLVPEDGLTKYLDATLKTGLASPAWYVFLVTGPGSGTTYADTDVLATHAGWTEDNTSYTGNRPAFTTSAAITCTGSGSCSLTNAASKASFTIDSTCSGGCTIAGAGLASVNTGTSGTLLGAGDFSGGDRSVVESDTLNVTITATIAKP
jgi:hypothetical protein